MDDDLGLRAHAKAMGMEDELNKLLSPNLHYPIPRPVRIKTIAVKCPKCGNSFKSKKLYNICNQCNNAFPVAAVSAK